ncbi:MAG: peptide chain release factor 1 [Nisaea sp.]|nr:peptide chain release factor 1 [Nisaea sp.]MEC7972358.1 peptide chain release factor 1 [Pseudomonadota bacterium]|tara:strand:+ start:1349 stop:2425 length:1077 start_codon:yes stop_codon:yes gene_type:complete
MSFESNLERVSSRHRELEMTLSTSKGLSAEDITKLSIELSELAPIAEKINEVRSLQKELNENSSLADENQQDKELLVLIQSEIMELSKSIGILRDELQRLLLPKDEINEKNAILEVRAGTGGDEAALFATELFSMYQRYSALRGWRFDILEISENDIGGYREAIASITGRSVFARLKFESGVHRVQRVPTTESGGRIHTSAATVAVLPEAEEVDVHIEDKDLRIDIFRASGPGGQSVNTTDSAVRITHLPTGIVVSQQDEKSQHKNKAKGMKILRARIFDLERTKRDAERAADRKEQVGTGDRSERIRTYNFPQGRVTDHRINLTLYKIDKVIAGEALDDIVDGLTATEEAARLAAMP